MDFPTRFDVIVVGGGHAGTEAALASSRMGLKTLLLSHNIETLGQMSCNPSIGGIGKGHLVKEIEAMGGIMGRAADAAAIHVRILNASKGPAVRATRVQADRLVYKQAVRFALENQENLWLFQQAVEDLLLDGDKVHGVLTQMGLRFYAKSVVMTVGTFLAAKIHIGLSNFEGGRAGDPPANSLAIKMRSLGFKVGRLKTGTPPRIDGRSIDYSCLETQPGDEPIPYFSFAGAPSQRLKQVPCYIARTTEKTHEIIRNGLSRSPLYTGVIEGTGPRYCPSIEDKVVRFADKNSHQIFIEPEGLSTHELYPNGLSTSLPFDVQLNLVQSMQGFEKAHITRPGYAIEYDYFDPQNLKPSLETQQVAGLFFAGQINGTTGYEEAAVQGLLAGMNAALYAQNKPAWTPKRHEAYLGVLVDDLITMGTIEPYRMFTSRAEYRLQLREDNADERLSPKAYELGLLSQTAYENFEKKQTAIANFKEQYQQWLIRPGSVHSVQLESLSSSVINKEGHALSLLKRPEITVKMLCEVSGNAIENYEPLEQEALMQVEIFAKYEGYIKRQAEEIIKGSKHEELRIPDQFDYSRMGGLSNELRDKLTRIRPSTVGMASRIQGMTPAAISLLLVLLKK